MFKEGDVVQLKSGGQFMTVEELDGNDACNCVWFEDSELKRSSIMNSVLKKVEEAPVAIV